MEEEYSENYWKVRNFRWLRKLLRLKEVDAESWLLEGGKLFYAILTPEELLSEDKTL